MCELSIVVVYVMLLYVHVGMFLCVRTYMYVCVYVSFLSMLFINFETDMISVVHTRSCMIALYKFDALSQLMTTTTLIYNTQHMT